MKEEEEHFGVKLVASRLVAMKDSRAITASDRWSFLGEFYLQTRDNPLLVETSNPFVQLEHCPGEQLQSNGIINTWGSVDMCVLTQYWGLSPETLIDDE